MPPATRRTEVLDAAVRVLGGQGARRLTHRAVDQEGGLPAGTTSNHFRTRDALVEGVLAHLAATEAALAGAAPVDLTGLDGDGLAEVLARQFAYLAGPARTLTLARFALFLESAWRPELRAAVAPWRGRFAEMIAEALTALGAPGAERDAVLLMDHFDGMLLHAVSEPEPGADRTPDIHRLVGLVLGR